MTNKELKEEITRLKTALAELEEKVEALPNMVGGVFKPDYGQKYWSIMRGGDVVEDLWNDNPFGHDRYAIGNCFPTEQAAEDAVRALKLIQKARESQGGFVPDWENLKQNKYTLYFNMGDIRTMTYNSRNIASIFGFWDDKLSRANFIHKNNEELLWFFTEYRRWKRLFYGKATGRRKKKTCCANT